MGEFATGRLAGVVYVCDDPGVARGVERAARQVRLDERHLRFWTLEDVQRQVRDLAAARPEGTTLAATGECR